MLWQGLAVDLGASSGRVMLGGFDGARIALEEVRRFENLPLEKDGALRWNFEGLLAEIRAGIREGIKRAPSATTLGIDTWGVDYGLLGRDGELLAAPTHYRDKRNGGMMEKTFARVPREAVFEATGIQFLPFNTIYQLAAETRLDEADCLLLMPDLFAYFLSGAKAVEFTNASTTQLMDPRTRDWNTGLMEKLGIPRRIFPKIVEPGSALGSVEGLKLVAVATHDTGSAVLGVPATQKDFAYLSCGTWSLIGLELDAPVLSAKACELNFTNEGGAFGTTRFLKNCMGLWLLQETRRAWDNKYSWPEIVALAASAPPLRSFIDPDDASFLAPGDMPERVRAFCQKTGQAVPDGDAALLRCIMESLALKYRLILGQLGELSGKKPAVLHMVGGGSQNRLLAQWAADACALPVVCGPTEASCLGNLGMQLYAAGHAASLPELRQVVAASSDLATLQPGDGAPWDAAFQTFKNFVRS
jgi:rhamnulokinase